MHALRAAALGAIASLMAAGILISRQHAFDHHQQTQLYQDRYYLPPPAWLQVGSLGFQEALADLIWIKALNNFGEELAHTGEAKYVFHYADSILTLDPNFRRAYLWIANVTMARRGNTVADAERAAAILEEGVKRFPDDGEMLWQLGAHLSYELPPMVADLEKRKAYRRKALPYLRAAAVLGAGPPWLGMVTVSGLESLGQKERAIHHLTELYMTVSDPDTKVLIGQRLAQMKSAAFSEALARTEFTWRQRKQAEYPYLSDTLYLLVGPRPPFDGAGQLARYFDPVTEQLSEDEDP